MSVTAGVSLFAIVTPGWSGERVLVRLLSAGPLVCCLGTVLGGPVPDPAAHVRRALRRPAPTNLAVGVVIRPDDLWLVNGVADPAEFVTRLAAEGVRLIELRRRSHEDFALSRLLCGPDMEVLPAAVQAVSADRMAVLAQNAGRAEQWLRDAMPQDTLRLVFEDDLAEATVRDKTAARLSEFLRLPPWSAPPECELPTSDALWRRVVDPSGLSAGLERLASAYSARA